MTQRRNSWFLFPLCSVGKKTTRGSGSCLLRVNFCRFCGATCMAGYNCKNMLNFILIFCVFAVTCVSAESRLKMVNLVYRHGDRSPLVFFPTDPNKDKWPQGPGWLTTVGMRQQYALGRFLRSEYEDLLNQTYKNTEITVSSSNVDRCLMSAYSNLAGLYPPQGQQVWNDALLWQPIPVHTRPQEEDHVLAIEERCPRYNQLYEERLRCPAVRQEENANRDFYKYLEEHTGVKTENISNAWEVADTLFCETTHNYSLPQWAEAKWGNTTVYEKLKGVGNFSFNLLFSGTGLSRLKGGPLLKVFINNMMKVTRHQPYYDMYMYSAHDSTVAAVSDALNVYEGVVPPYATALLVELHEDSSGFCVRIRLRNETDVPPVTLVNPDCQKECCPLNELVSVTKSRIPEDWEAECGNKPSFVPHSGVVIGVLAAINCLLILCLLAASMVVCRLRSRKKEYMSLS